VLGSSGERYGDVRACGVRAGGGSGEGRSGGTGTAVRRERGGRWTGV